MPGHKGVEPFMRVWTVNYKVIVKSAAIPAGTLLSRPRSVIFFTQADADSFREGLISQAAPTDGHPAPGTIQTPFMEKYVNSKSFVSTFLNEHIQFLVVGA